MNFKIISIASLITLIVAFIFQNAAVVEVKFLFWSMQLSRSLLIFILLAIGIIIGTVLGWSLRTHFKTKDTKTT